MEEKKRKMEHDLLEDAKIRYIPYSVCLMCKVKVCMKFSDEFTKNPLNLAFYFCLVFIGISGRKNF